MRGWKQLVAAGVVVVVGATAGVAWAGTQRADRPTGAAQVTPLGGPTRILGNGRTGTRFVALPPCRLVDTRQGANTPMADQEKRRFDVRGNGVSFALQGGTAAGCGIPTTGVSAVEVTVTAIDATGTGFIRVFPNTEPNATFFNYSSAFDISNTGTVTICYVAGCPADDDLAVKNYGSATDLVIDVQGYYEQPIAAMVAANGTLTRGSRVAAAFHLAVGVYQVSFDREIESCAYHGGLANTAGAGTIGEIGLSDDGGSTTDVRVITRNSTGANTDQPFFIEVVC